jgi:hypothetical protein
MRGRFAPLLVGVAITAVFLWLVVTPEVLADLQLVASVANCGCSCWPCSSTLSSSGFARGALRC